VITIALVTAMTRGLFGHAAQMALIGSAVIPLSEREDVRAGREDGSGDEAVPEFVAQSCQVPCVARGHRCARLDLKAKDTSSIYMTRTDASTFTAVFESSGLVLVPNDSRSGELRDYFDLMTIERRTGRTADELGLSATG
jgi:hypothetical protein